MYSSLSSRSSTISILCFSGTICIGIKGVHKGKLNIKNYQRIVTKIVHENPSGLRSWARSDKGEGCFLKLI